MSIEEFADFIDKEPWCDGNCTEVDECKDCIIDFFKQQAVIPDSDDTAGNVVEEQEDDITLEELQELLNNKECD